MCLGALCIGGKTKWKRRQRHTGIAMNAAVAGEDRAHLEQPREGILGLEYHVLHAFLWINQGQFRGDNIANWNPHDHRGFLAKEGGDGTRSRVSVILKCLASKKLADLIEKKKNSTAWLFYCTKKIAVRNKCKNFIFLGNKIFNIIVSSFI